MHLRAQIQGEPALDEPNDAKDPSHFVTQAEHFADCVLHDKTPKAPGEEGLRDMRYIDAIYKSCGLKLGSE
jgi:predicted dehydrogenase